MAGPADEFSEESPARLIVEHTPEAWAVVDSGGHVTFVNAAAEQFSRRTREELLGQPLRQVFPDLGDTEFRHEYETALARRTASEAVIQHEAAAKWYRCRLIPLPDGTLAAGVTDITSTILAEHERDNQAQELHLASEQRLQESEERLRLATEGAELGIWDYQIEEDRLHWSALGRRLLGLPATETSISLRAFLDRVHPDDIAAVEENLRHALTDGREYNVEFRVIGPDGAQRWMASRGVRVLNEEGRPVRFYGTLADNTERKRAEEELVHQSEQLARSNADLQQFAYVTSHDMQEPLRGIASFAQLLAQRYKGQLDKDADEFIGYIINGVRRMSILIDDLLVYSRLVNVERTPASLVDMNGVVQWAKMNLQQALAESRGYISHDPLPTVMGDQVQFVQLLQNLLSNAVKYHRRDVPPHVRVSAERQGDEWVFAVLDNGIGIEPQFHDRIFGLFKRLHGRDVPGTGIGLTICRKIVEQHGGRIWVDSQPGRGSTFYFSLPAGPERH